MLEYRHGFEKIEELDFQKGNGLIPAIVQNAQDGQVLMLGYMNRVSFFTLIACYLFSNLIYAFRRAQLCRMW